MSRLPQPIGRLAFLVRFVIALAAFILLFILLEFPLAITIYMQNQTGFILFLLLGFIWLITFLFMVMCFARFVVIARLASIGANRWYALLILVPMVNVLFYIFLLVCPARAPVAEIVPKPAPQ